MAYIETRALQVFLAAAEARSFSEAGRVLDISQPAVSRQIQSLEKQIGTTLFERTATGLALTSAGQYLQPRAQRLLADTSGLFTELQAFRTDVQGELVVAFSASAAAYVLPHLLMRFKGRVPDAHITTRQVSQGQLEQGLLSGDYQIGITDIRTAGRGFEYVHLFDDPLALIAPANHPWASRRVIAPADMLGQKYICRDAASACRQAVAQALKPHNLDPRDFDIVMEVPSAEALAMAVEHGMGVSFVSLLAAHPRLASGRLAIVEVAGVALQTQISVVRNPNCPTSPLQLALMQFLQSPESTTMIADLMPDEVFAAA